MKEEYKPKNFIVRGGVILGLAPFSMDPVISKVKVTYRCSRQEEAWARACVQGFIYIDNILEETEDALDSRL